MSMVNDQEAIGARLKKIRLEKGISLDEAHRITKVHLEVLKAIEDDNYININPVYLKGFLKIYCKFLGVELPASFSEKKHTQVRQSPGQTSLVQEPAKEKIEKRFERIRRNPALEAAREKAGRVQEGVPAKLPFSSESIRKAVTVSIVCAFAVCAVFLVSAGWRFAAKKAAQGRKKTLHAQAVRATKGTLARKSSSEARASAVSGNIPRDESLRLGVRAIDDCWLQLKADNKVVFQNVLKKGRFESWEAKDRMDLVLGSAGGVQLEINGKIIPPLGKRGQVLKNIQITRNNGLQVGK